MEPVFDNGLILRRVQENYDMICQMMLFSENRRKLQSKRLDVPSESLKTQHRASKLEIEESSLYATYKRLPWDPEINFICN